MFYIYRLKLISFFFQAINCFQEKDVKLILLQYHYLHFINSYKITYVKKSVKIDIDFCCYVVRRYCDYEIMWSAVGLIQQLPFFFPFDFFHLSIVFFSHSVFPKE